MSDTPITDKKAIDITGGLYGVTHLRRNPKGNFVRVNFARQLERENAALRKWVKEEGKENDVCTYGILKEVCEDCRCGMRKEAQP